VNQNKLLLKVSEAKSKNLEMIKVD